MSEPKENNASQDPVENRRIRIFISSTFRDMIEDRNVLMSHAWPQLQRFCNERQVELVEVDMRWGITEEQSTRKETLKFCLDEIRSCRPYFIGLIGERYGWVPGEESYTADLKEEEPWLGELKDKSVTELEILHGVLNNPDMAGRSFFYFRDPKYSEGRGPDFQAEDIDAGKKRDALKKRISEAHEKGQTYLHDEKYPDPVVLSELALKHLKSAIEKQFSKEDVPDALTREANSHEYFAKTRRQTYIGRDDYYKILDSHADSPLILLGDSGSGKSALLANWIAHWRKEHPNDFIFQHYIGGTSDSADHWQLMRRLMAEIKKWSDDPDDLPTSHDDIARDFPLWLSKARLKAERDSVRCILILDALNQLKNQDNSHLFSWLPSDIFTGQLCLIVSTLPGETMDAVKKRGWKTLHIEKLTEDERQQMTTDYLKRFSKKLDQNRINKIITAPATANPLYLKILLDELRITGTHDKLDERLSAYLAEPNIPSLLKNVITRYQCHYEKDRKGLVREVLGLIFSARRGLSEKELLQLLRPANLKQLPPKIWMPLQAAMEELLIDRGGVLNFAHDFLRTAVKETFVSDTKSLHDFRLQLADYFEKLPASARNCYELPWLLQQLKTTDRLRTCLLKIDCFLAIFNRDEEELRSYWVGLGEEIVMGNEYLEAFKRWINRYGLMYTEISYAASNIAYFLTNTALYKEAEPLYRKALSTNEKNMGVNHPDVATNLNNLAELLRATNRIAEAEPLYQRALSIEEKSSGKESLGVAATLNNLAQLMHSANRMDEAEPLMRKVLSIAENSLGKDHHNVATSLNNLALLLLDTNRMAEAESLMRRALSIDEKKLGKEHPSVARDLNNLALLLKKINRVHEVEPLYRRALSIIEKCFGKDHPRVAITLNNLARLLKDTNRMDEAELLYRKALIINENSLGKDHPNVATHLNGLARILEASNRTSEAEQLYRKALSIYEKSFGKEHLNTVMYLNNLAVLLHGANRMTEAESLFRRALSIDEKKLGVDHPDVATNLNNLAELLRATNRIAEAEPLMRRALSIDEKKLGKEHPSVARDLNNLACLLESANRMDEAEPLRRRTLTIFIDHTFSIGYQHPHLQDAVNSYIALLKSLGYNRNQIITILMRDQIILRLQDLSINV